MAEFPSSDEDTLPYKTLLQHPISNGAASYEEKIYSRPKNFNYNILDVYNTDQYNHRNEQNNSSPPLNESEQNFNEIEHQISESLDHLSTNNTEPKNYLRENEDDDPKFRKRIRVGNHYQARIPKCSTDLKDSSAEGELLWDPFMTESSSVEEFLQKVSAISKLLIPMGMHLRDDEQALYILQQNNHNVDAALKLFTSELAPNSTVWSESECRNFENGLLSFGKNFFLIQKYKVPTRKVGELVQFYYLWKKTERYDLFANRIRTGKKKYSLNPGISDLMCRYMGGQTGNLPPLAPNVQFVLTGNNKNEAQHNLQY